MEHKLELGDDDILAYESLMMKNELQKWSLGDGFWGWTKNRVRVLVSLSLERS